MTIDSSLYTHIFTHQSFAKQVDAQALLTYLLESPTFAPTHWGMVPPYFKVKLNDLSKMIDIVSENRQQQRGKTHLSSLTHFEHQIYPKGNYNITWSTHLHNPFSMNSYDIELDYVRKPANLRDWLEFVYGLLPHYKPDYLHITSPQEYNAKHRLSWQVKYPKKVTTTEGVVGLKLEGGVPSICWGTYFSAFYVAWFGREKFDNLPCVEQKWFEDGGVFFTIAETPFDWDTPAGREREQAIKKQLGEKAFFDLEMVKIALEASQPIPHTMAAEFYQPPRWTPVFPFEIKYKRRPQTRAGVVRKPHYDTPIMADEERNRAYGELNEFTEAFFNKQKEGKLDEFIEDYVQKRKGELGS